MAKTMKAVQVKAPKGTLNFSARSGSKAMVERYPLEKADEAYHRMMKHEARFRVVLEIA